jgi:hypothetical protein
MCKEQKIVYCKETLSNSELYAFDDINFVLEGLPFMFCRKEVGCIFLWRISYWRILVFDKRPTSDLHFVLKTQRDMLSQSWAAIH